VAVDVQSVEPKLRPKSEDCPPPAPPLRGAFGEKIEETIGLSYEKKPQPYPLRFITTWDRVTVIDASGEFPAKKQCAEVAEVQEDETHGTSPTSPVTVTSENAKFRPSTVKKVSLVAKPQPVTGGAL
jgi:hypothetical protein